MPSDTSRHIAADDRYETGRRRGRARSAMLSTALFYPRLACIVLAASRKAKRGRYDRIEWTKSSITTLQALEKAGCRVEIDGMSNISGFEGPAVFVANHMSTAETFLLPGIIDPVKHCTFVIKPSLMDYPFFGRVMRSRKPIVVSRDNPRRDLSIVLEEGLKKLEAGTSIVLFPQTTRVIGFDPARFNSLGVKLARSAGVPVAPVALRTDAWGNGRLIKEFGRIDPNIPIRISFGEAEYISGNGREEHARISDYISGKLRLWGAPTAAVP